MGEVRELFRTCIICHKPKPVSKFRRTDGYCGNQCRSCLAREGVERNRLLRERRRKQHLCVNCGKKLSMDEKAKCGECRENKRKWDDSWRKKNWEKYAKQRKDRHQALKIEVFNAYGGAKCKCCGEEHIEFLSIDHMNNDGGKHRKQLFGTNSVGSQFYSWLKKNNFPKGFQVLCMNCNFAKGHFGCCPHEKERMENLKFKNLNIEEVKNVT